jgi:ubiquinone/menaquinone biosynthesis C-methylase UbiE
MRRITRLRIVSAVAAVLLIIGRQMRRTLYTRDTVVSPDDETARIRRYYDEIADQYDRGISIIEKVLFADGRRWVGSQARGDVLEIAIGTGRNLPYYPDDVRLTGIDLSPSMLDITRRRAADLRRDADLQLGDAQHLPFPNNRFDTVVATLALCTIPDEHLALAEARRVLRPGGRLILLEHVGSDVPLVRAAQWVLDPLFARFAADHLLREPRRFVEAEGFVIEQVERSRWGIIERIAARKRTEQ